MSECTLEENVAPGTCTTCRKELEALMAIRDAAGKLAMSQLEAEACAPNGGYGPDDEEEKAIIDAWWAWNRLRHPNGARTTNPEDK